MFTLKKMSIRKKLYLLVGLLSILVIIIGFYSMDRIHEANMKLKNINEERIAPLQELKGVSDLYAVNIVDATHKIRNGNITWEEGSENINNAIQEIDELWTTYQSIPKDHEEQIMMERAGVLFENANKSIEDLKRIVEKKDMVALIDYTEGELYSKIDPISEYIGKLVSFQLDAAEKIYISSEERYKRILIVFPIIIVVGLGAALFISSRIVKIILRQLDVMRTGIQKDETGHITVKDIEVITEDEVGELAISLNKMTEQVRSFVHMVNGSCEKLTLASSHLNSMSGQSALAANDVAAAIEGIAVGASEQAKYTEEGSTNAAILGELIAINLELLKEVNNATIQADKLKNEGVHILSGLVEKTNETDRAINDAYEVIKDTKQSAEKINVASQMIKNIADQTNLLALNAAIEAARAGESGKGFAVVAEEIRQLAEQSNNFTNEISDSINDLSTKANFTVKTMEDVRSIVSVQIEGVMATNEKFEGITKSIEELLNGIHELSTSGQEMNTQKNNMNAIMENLSAISEENAASTEEASASVEEQTATMNEIANKTEELSEVANIMQTGVSTFKM